MNRPCSIAVVSKITESIIQPHIFIDSDNNFKHIKEKCPLHLKKIKIREESRNSPIFSPNETRDNSQLFVRCPSPHKSSLLVSVGGWIPTTFICM